MALKNKQAVPPQPLIENKAAVPKADRKVLIALTFYQDGGATHELNMSALPKTGRELAALIGNVHLCLHQLDEWATAIFHMNDMAMAQQEAMMRDVLEKLPEDGVVN